MFRVKSNGTIRICRLDFKSYNYLEFTILRIANRFFLLIISPATMVIVGGWLV